MAYQNAPPYLITLGFDPATFDRLDALRQQYFPPERNQVPAHLSLFHQLPGDDHEAIDLAIDRVAGSHPPVPLRFGGVKSTGKGIMLVTLAPGLAAIRNELAKAFDRHLTPQDRQPYHPHVMVMNKAERDEVDRAIRELQASWSPWTGMGDRLILWRYLGGPWSEAGSYPLIGPARDRIG